VTAIVDKLDLPTDETRAAIRQGRVSEDAFRAAFADLRCLRQLEQVPPPRPAGPPPEAVRVLFWNAERLKYLEASVALVKRAEVDACLLCELDYGMVRSGNLHTIAELARATNAGYVFGVEFVELDLGDARERAWHARGTNACGVHGAGLISPRLLGRPALVRLETSGRWFDGAFGERRVGGRIAVMAELTLAAGPVLLVSVHYESHTGPVDRRSQTREFLDAIDAHAPNMPVLIGGDFNTNTLDRSDEKRPELVRAALEADPDRLVRPMAYEPMFEEMRARGYDWESCNVGGVPTQRTRPDGTPKPPLGRIDWYFARGLVCSAPAVLPAVNDAGVAISDHEALAVTIRLPER
jgi:endonuclease/exonuclease/phosphatase family metal-dependent hydrolase